MALIYQSGQEGSVGETTMTETCILEKNEKVTNITVFTRDYQTTLQIISGVKLTTTHQTCGPFGTATPDIEEASGHQLLYVSGGAGGLLDSLVFHFDYGCIHT